MSSWFDLDFTEKLISCIAGLLAIGAAIAGFLYRRRKDLANSETAMPTNQNINNINVSVGTPPQIERPTGKAKELTDTNIQSLKRHANILFVDDDKEFKMYSILRRMGWQHTKQIVDINSLELPTLLDAHIVFVDIQGVGISMQCKDEGLGLALEIKRRHPEKRVVIYSAEEHGARFHEALQAADATLPKTAEPIRFENTIVGVLSK